MKKNLLDLLLMAFVSSCLCMGIASCKDNDDDDSKSEQRNDDADALDTEQAQTAWRWLCTMTDAETLPDNWESKTFEPTIGQPSENNKLTRIVVVTDFDDAAQQFASIADVQVSKLTQEQKFSQTGVGSLTWTPSKAGAQNLAEVAVDIKNIPNLQKLVYCTADQVGENGIFFDNVKGTAYYRFGDVVRDQDGYYWVCVRPSFAPDKGESHWINVFNASPSGDSKNIPADNLYTKYNNLAKYNNQTIILPTKLPYSREHIYNLANLTWAMTHPEDYRDVCNGGKGLGGFSYDYNGYNFVNRVADFWDRTYNGKTIWEIVFHCTRADITKMNILNFFYKGYSWKWGQTGKVWDFTALAYQPVIPASETDDKVAYDFVSDGFNANYLAGAQGAVMKPASFGDNNGYWLVRYKRGDKLWGNIGSYSPYEKLQACTDIYRYNQITGTQVHDSLETEKKAVTVPVSQAKVGDIIAFNGNIYRTMNDVKDAKTTAAAIVCYSNPGGTAIEKLTSYHGLAIATKDLQQMFQWVDKPVKDSTCLAKVQNDVASGMNYFNGIADNSKLERCKKKHHHLFVTALGDCKKIDNTQAFANYLSGWFVPSIKHLELALTGMGLQYNSDKKCFEPIDKNKTCQQIVKEFFDNGNKGDLFQGMTENANRQNYWLVDENSDQMAWTLAISPNSQGNNTGSISYELVGKEMQCSVRPFMAFGNSGK